MVKDLKKEMRWQFPPQTILLKNHLISKLAETIKLHLFFLFVEILIACKLECPNPI